MILAIDIGNTTVSLALVKGLKVQKIWQVMTQLSSQRFRREFQKVSSKVKKTSPIEAVIICSVVPVTSNVVKREVTKIFGLKPLIIGKDIVVPIKNCYRRPQEVGQDRLVCAFSAMTQYGKPLIVIDFGTAITFDVVSTKGEYLGGAIVPGLRLYAESLYEKTALLPKVKIVPTKEIIGRDTKSSILSGIFHGYGALCDGMIQKISQQFKIKPGIVVTGGNTAVIKSFLSYIDYIDPVLIFKGIAMVYRNCCVD